MIRTPKIKKVGKIFLAIILCLSILFVSMCVIQRFWAHRNGYFVPEYERVELTEDSDYQTIFLQTGLGPSAVDKLIAEGNFQGILDAQEAFFHPPQASCNALLGWFTREDKSEKCGVPLIDLQPGDIVVSLSTHSLGWRHGHAGLMVDEDSVLESAVLGEDSEINSIDGWNRYSNYAVLRLKNITKDEQNKIVAYANEVLKGVPYTFTAGFIGPKAPDSDTWYFGTQCSYLVWYAYQHFGYDLDSDGGRLVSTHDLLHSDLLEVVQIYGMNPYDFLE